MDCKVGHDVFVRGRQIHARRVYFHVRVQSRPLDASYVSDVCAYLGPQVGVRPVRIARIQSSRSARSGCTPPCARRGAMLSPCPRWRGKGAPRRRSPRRAIARMRFARSGRRRRTRSALARAVLLDAEGNQRVAQATTRAAVAILRVGRARPLRGMAAGHFAVRCAPRNDVTGHRPEPRARRVGQSRLPRPRATTQVSEPTGTRNPIASDGLEH